MIGTGLAIQGPWGTERLEMPSTKWSCKAIAMMIILGTFAGVATAGTISLQWDAVAAADGYRIYYSTTSQQYNPQNYYQVGRVTQATVPGLQDCTTYYLAIKAFNSGGESETYSEEISGWARPTINGTVHSIRQGSQIELEIQGSNFMGGVQVEVDNPNVRVDSVSSPQCDSLVIGLSVEPLNEGVRAAEIGDIRLSVVNPDQVFTERAGAIEVLLDSARFNFNRTDEATANRVDGKDLVWMAGVFGVNENNARYDPDYDLDGDGSIDGADLSYIVSNMGGCWSGTNWTSTESGWSINDCPAELR